MEYKPTITYSFSESGDESLFLTLSTHLRKVLASQLVKWKRSYGRIPHELALDVKFLPLTVALLERSDLVTRPYFHIFWTDCNDLDYYRASVKGEISSWLSELRGHDISDWLIVVVTGDGTSKSNKSKLTLPRTSLADKVKTDFCSKSPDRIQILQDPMKDSTKTSESWSSLAIKIASFTVSSLEDAVTKYEDRVRAERERRNEKTWNFCSYFIMQEELAFMFEMLSLHEEALIQYNELDAMFTQYLLNAHAGDVAHWLSSFMKPITQWRSLTLWRRIDGEARQTLIDGNASLIDVRNYLFARHCHLLFAIKDMKRVTELMHTFLHSTTLELDILEIDLPPGAKECWVFMSCMELTQSLERTRVTTRSSCINGGDTNSEILKKLTDNDLGLEIANLWNLARSKLLHLGELCGLMPDVDTSSENLQTVINLISGMGDEEERDGIVKPPSLILREALSSKENFRGQYLELSELAMGTFKHTDRYRSARNIGKDLGEFYMRSGQPEKAETFLIDCVRMYTNEGWLTLVADASERLALCYKRMCNVRRYVRLCCALMCSPYISPKKRSYYCDELQSLSTDFGDHSLPILLAVFANVTSVQFVPAQTSFRHKSTQHILMRVHSKAPKPMRFHSMQMSLRHHNLTEEENLDMSTTSDILDEEQELDALSYTTFSSDEENNLDNESLSSTKQTLLTPPKKPTSKNHVRRKRRRYISTGSYDSVYTISQKTLLDPDGKVQLIPMEEPFIEPSKCVVNRLPPVIHVTYEFEEKEEEILWAGITCRSARQLLRRQDSYQSLCSIHSSTTNIVMETYTDNLEVKDVTVNPGENVIEVPINTSKPGHYNLRQLRFSVNKLHFVLPRVLPVISYTTTRDKPTLELEHEPRLYCNIEQIINVKLMTGDYELSESSDDRILTINTPKHLKVCRIVKMSTQSKSGDTVEVSSSIFQIEENRCTLEIPHVPVQSTVSIKLCCICARPVAHDPGRKAHRRTHSAPPTTLHKHVQVSGTNHLAVNGVGKFRTSSNVELKFFRSPFTRRPNVSAKGGGSPVKKFLTFVREVADRVDAKSSKTEKENSESTNTSDLSVLEKDEFLEVTLEENSGDGSDVIDSYTPDLVKDTSSSGSASAQVSDGTSSHETVSVSSLSSTRGIIPRITETAPVSKSNIHQRHTLAIHEEHVLEDDNKVLCNISLSLPWSDLPPVSTSVNFNPLLNFSHKMLRSYSTRDSQQSDSLHLCQIVSVIVENSSPFEFFLKNFSLKTTDPANAKFTGFLQNSLKRVQPSQSLTFAWKVHFTSTMPLECNVQFSVDVLSDTTDSSTVTPVSYKFEIEDVQTLYIVSTGIGEPGEQLVGGQMTTLKITVERIRRDPEHEHTRGGQQLLMYQVIDTRGRWAVCGKSTGVLSLPISTSESELGPPVATVNLEVMPLISGLLHRPNVIFQRYLKRRSGEFDEQLSSTESPVLKPPRLMDFRNGEVVNIDEYKQVQVCASPSTPVDNANDGSNKIPILSETKL